MGTLSNNADTEIKIAEQLIRVSAVFKKTYSPGAGEFVFLKIVMNLMSPSVILKFQHITLYDACHLNLIVPDKTCPSPYIFELI